MAPGDEPELPTVSEGHIPRISRLMALAIRFEQLIHDGVVKDQAEVARLAMVSRARVTQIMDLLMLAPVIQEALLFLQSVQEGRDPITERDMRQIVSEPSWMQQQLMSRKVRLATVLTDTTRSRLSERISRC